MGKPKKEKKGQQAEDFGDDDLTIDPLAGSEVPLETSAGKEAAAEGKAKKGEVDSEESDEDRPTTTKEDVVESTTSKKPAPKKKKGKKKKDDDWEDDVAAELAALSMEANSGQATEENGVGGDVQPTVKKKVKTRGKKATDENDEGVADKESEVPKKQPQSKKKTVATFQMLDMLDDNSGSEADDKASEDDVPDIPVEVKETSKKQKKKTKEKEKKKTAEDADMEALMAEINKPVEKSSKKSKKEKKRRKAEEEMEADDVTTPGEQSQQTSAVEPGDAPIDALEELAIEQEDFAISKEKDGEMEAKVEEEDEGEHTVKTAAQKKKEKKEREKLKKQKTKTVKTKQTSFDDDKPDAEASTSAAGAEEGGAKEGDEKEEETGKKKKTKGEKEEKGKKKPKKAIISAMKEALQKAKDENERLKEEEDERIRKEDEAILKLEEQKKLEEERKERKRQKEREKKERLRAEGKLLTEKQKQDRRRAMQMLELMKQQGLEVPSKDGPKKKPVYGDKKKKKRPQTEDGQATHDQTPSPTEELISKEEATPEERVPTEAPIQEMETEDVSEADDTKDAWDAESEEETEDEPDVAESAEKTPSAEAEVKVSESDEDDEGEDDDDAGEESDEDDQEETDEDEDASDDEESEEESSDEDESDSEEELTAVEKGRRKIMTRQEEAEKKRSVDVLRAPVVCVLGHVDTGKTKILDKLRRTNVQDGEAGGITQQIGATNVPAEAIKEKTTMCKDFTKAELKLPGMLIIDTPGHASFSNLRTRGSSLCDVAILVVDIMHGLEPQTIESINLLKKKKTPFVVALNKIDRLYQWKTNPNTDVVNTIKKQQAHTKQEFDERTQEIVVQFAEQSLNVALFYKNKNKREYISMVPTSAHTGDGMGNLVSQICELSQSMLAKRLAYSEELQATVMEVKAIHGLGTAIDVILVNGKVHEGETIVVAGTEGPIVTQIRGLLMPQPMKELRVKNSYDHFKEVHAAQGVKVIAKDLDKALAGLPFYVAHGQDEIEYYKEDVAVALKEVLGAIKVTERGVFVQASTLGSLEALLEFLKESKISYAGINIGPVHKKDIMKASVMLEHDRQYAVILAFDVKVERDAQELAEGLGVTIFTADIIYHLFDKFMAHRDELKKRRQEAFKHIAVFPCKLRILPQCIFNTRDPIVVGVSVEAGFVREGTPLCVPSKEFIDIGRVSSIEINHKTTNVARKGQEVCIKIDPIGDTPKLYGRHFDHTDILCSKISRQSIDAVKDYFREDMQKTDWQLMVQLKKMFEIL